MFDSMAPPLSDLRSKLFEATPVRMVCMAMAASSMRASLCAETCTHRRTFRVDGDGALRRLTHNRYCFWQLRADITLLDCPPGSRILLPGRRREAAETLFYRQPGDILGAGTHGVRLGQADDLISTSACLVTIDRVKNLEAHLHHALNQGVGPLFGGSSHDDSLEASRRAHSVASTQLNVSLFEQRILQQQHARKCQSAVVLR